MKQAFKNQGLLSIAFVLPQSRVHWLFVFDGVIDFDAVVRDPQPADRLRPASDCGSHLHPSPAGHKAMGESIPLTLFTR